MLTTTTRPLLLLAAVAVPLLTGCPETLDDPMVAGKGAAGNSAAVAKAIAEAKATQNLPKLPDLDKLCAPAPRGASESGRAGGNCLAHGCYDLAR